MTTPDSPTEPDADAPVEPLDDQHLRHLRIFLDCNVTAIKSGTVRALILRLDAAESENEQLRRDLAIAIRRADGAMPGA